MKLRMAGIIFILFGLFFGFAGVKTVLAPKTDKTDAVADAKVVDFEVERIEKVSKSGRKVYEINVPIYEFIDKDGITHRVKAAVYSDFQEVKLGDVTTIEYDSSDPEGTYVVASEKELSIVPLLAGVGFGLVSIVVGIFMVKMRPTMG